MRRFLFLVSCLMACTAMNVQAQTKSWTADNGNGTFTNPLFYDEFSDPDIIRVGDDYYLAGTTMHTVPGLVILHSKDLVNWENISYCFDRFDFPDDKFALKNHQEIYGQGIWAPAIRYANGMFYVFSNINGKGLQCYTAKDIHGPWTHHNMQGNIYDLSVLFDDDGKIYAIHKYGEVHCTELKPDMSGPIEGTDRVIIPEGNGVGEGHHMYKINGMYYLISTDYSPNGRTLCSRSKNIWGPYETRVISADETYGYHGVGRTTVPRGTKYRIGEDGTKFGVSPASADATGCDNAHQGGIVQAKDGTWWALLMQDFHSIGRTVCLMPMTWEDGWPMVGLKGNLGRAPRTWFKPDTKLGCYGIGEEPQPISAPYNRNEDFNGKQLGRVWQWNHNPDDKMWSLKNGKLRLNSMPAEQLMWARNTLTQRVIGPKSITTVELSVNGLKDGDVAGLGNINIPCSWIGISLPPSPSKRGGEYLLRCFEQMTNDTISLSVDLPDGKIWLRCIGEYDDNQAQYAYSLDGKTFKALGRMMPLTYQLITFQGSRHALFAFNIKGKNGGYAEFDNFTVEEPMADRSKNIPYGKTIRIINKATGRPAIALKHGMLYDTHAGDKSELTQFRVIGSNGTVSLQCADGRYVKVYGDGLPGDVRFTNDLMEAERFLWQDFLDHDFMLLSLKNHRYIGKSPTTGSPYSMDFAGPDPARRNGAVLHWEEVVGEEVTMKNGDVTMTINIEKGGKILSLKYQDKEVLSQSRWPESFGSTFWTAPQKEWNWPPVQEFDKQAYTIQKKEDDRLVITSPVSQRLGLSVGKDFQIDKKDGAFVITYSIKNEGKEPRRVAPWEISRVPNADGQIFFEAVDSIWPADLMTFEKANGASWYKTDEAQQNRKVNADARGWLAYVADGLLLVKRFQDLKGNEPAPGEAEVQVYVNRGKSYIELESQGAYTLLQPGESLQWTVCWYLMPADTANKKEMLKKISALPAI